MKKILSVIGIALIAISTFATGVISSPTWDWNFSTGVISNVTIVSGTYTGKGTIAQSTNWVNSNTKQDASDNLTNWSSASINSKQSASANLTNWSNISVGITTNQTVVNGTSTNTLRFTNGLLLNITTP